jgi:hypothetical protein
MAWVWSKLFPTGIAISDRNQVVQASAILEEINISGVFVPPSQLLGDVRVTAQVVYRSAVHSLPAPAGVLAFVDVLVTVEYIPLFQSVISANVTRVSWSIKAVQ